MALRQGMSSLARSVMGGKALPMRGGGGGPIKYAEAPTKPVPLWDELWYDDGQLHSQPVLDFVGEPTQFTPSQARRQLLTALGLVGVSIGVAFAAWSPAKQIYVPQQYPPETMEVFTSRNKVDWTTPPTGIQPY